MINDKLKNIKFFIGPMSKNIVDTIINFSNENNYNIGIVASRRQIDYNGGYVNNWKTSGFIKYIKEKTNNVIIERDHGGIAQGEYFDNGILSYYEDCISNIDIIHIDPWKYYKEYDKGLRETIDIIKLIDKINSNVLYEVGTEQAIKHFSTIELDKFLNDLKNNLDNYLFDKIAYAVIQSGTRIKGITNTGEFDINRLKEMVDVCNKYNILSKEHNGDYLSKKEITIRFDNGLNAINIAPEFGVFETSVILEELNENDKEYFFNICYKSNMWNKWVDENFKPLENRNELMKICGHYQFSNNEFKALNLNLNNLIQKKLYNKIKNLIIL